MEIDYDKDFKKVMAELQTNFGWSNIEVLPDSYIDLLNDTIKAVKNCSIHDVSDTLILTPKDVEVFFKEIMNPKEANEALKKAMLKFITR